MNLDRCWLSSRGSKRRKKEFREAVKLNPTYEPGYFHLGVTLSSEGEREKAQAVLEQAVTLDPQDASAWYYRGTALDAAGNPDEACVASSKRPRSSLISRPCRPAWVFYYNGAAIRMVL